MIQRFLAVILPLALPFLLYGVYIWALRRAGKDPRTEERKLKPFVWLLGSGLLLMLVSLLVFRFYIDPEILSRPDRPALEEPRKRTGFPSEYGTNR